jgi:hypothetical protein
MAKFSSIIENLWKNIVPLLKRTVNVNNANGGLKTTICVLLEEFPILLVRYAALSLIVSAGENHNGIDLGFIRAGHRLKPDSIPQSLPL